MTKIKLCGLMTAADAGLVNLAQPDFAGVVLAPGRHQVTGQQAAIIRQQLNRAIPLVGVFIQEDLTEILALVAADVIQMVQFHGPRPSQDIRTLQSLGVPVIQVEVGVQAITTLKARQGRNQEPKNQSGMAGIPADFLMVDAGAGSGRQLDWQTLTSLTMDRLFVAGGINPANLSTLLELCQPYAVDISSGSERNGQKDLTKMKELVGLAHQGGKS